MCSTVDRDWNIFCEDGSLSNIGTYGILILNRRISLSPEKMCQLWSNACWRVTVDGGTDRWFNFVKDHSLNLPPPNYVTGDFDSIKPETMDLCKKQDGITVLNTPDQDFTDFDKGLHVLITTCPQKLDCFLVVCENSGRLDQIFSNLNTLCRASLDGFLITKPSICWVLPPGKHRIHIPPPLCNQSELCGVLPLSKPAKVSSKGLKWNLNNNIIEFGGLISSSNTYDGSPVVELTTDTTIIWTMSHGK
ncbi:thiamin pyrophosphokinase 1 [Halyomorpha halys]|uniref:thiamin pyrophosphokinase 1 n=1 Tax=Halyomorpha halys TaxID=286706 RepID=UPI0006D5057B|nr:thiamin pyrophosphokinase 1-like [Halyomorpha halys]